MRGTEPAPAPAPADTTLSWRDQAVARSLDPARVRAEQRVQRFLDAALELMNADSAKDFTVQEVVERSGQSLRSFYQYFAGKYELLLALFEEAVRSTAAELREILAEEQDPMERLHRFTVEYYARCRPSSKGKSAKVRATPAMAEFAQQLMTQHPEEASQAYLPVVSLLEELLDDAAEAGLLRSDLRLRHRRLAGVVLQAIMFNAFASTITGSTMRPDGGHPAEDLWDLIAHGIAANP